MRRGITELGRQEVMQGLSTLKPHTWHTYLKTRISLNPRIVTLSDAVFPSTHRMCVKCLGLIYLCVCVCMYVRMCARMYTHTHTHTLTATLAGAHAIWSFAAAPALRRIPHSHCKHAADVPSAVAAAVSSQSLLLQLRLSFTATSRQTALN